LPAETSTSSPNAGATSTLEYQSPLSAAADTSPPWYQSYRWWICALLFLATTINYLDRQALAMLKPLLEKQLNWTEAEYGWMGFAFTAAYALGFFFAGRVVDVLGVRWGFALGVIVWSISLMCHSLAHGVIGFGIARFMLGLGESTNFPACIKTIARWFPQSERALATGIFNSGSNVGIIIAPVVFYIAMWWHWQAAFIVTGLVGLLWVFLWLANYREPEVHPRVSPRELAYIERGRGEQRTARMHWTTILRHKQAWPFLLGKFLTDPVWWFYLFWLPSYLKDARGLTLQGSVLFVVIPYVAADIGSIAGGWISSAMIKRGYNVGTARYIAMGICAACMPASIGAAYTGNFALALTFISLATAGHQGWSANLFTTASDMFPAQVTGSVVGLGGTSGAVGGMFMTLLVGLTLQWTNKYYLPIFIWAGCMHPLSLLIYILMVGPRMMKADVDRPEDLRLNTALMTGGAVAVMIGAAALILVRLHWGYLVKAAGISGAGGGATASVCVILIGLVLLYAGLPKSSRLSAQSARPQ
jgi:ACS family hexuronate transporter-like MFS transporter